MKKRIMSFLWLSLLLLPLSATAQDVDPQAYYIDDNKTSQISNSISNAQAPLEVTFKANPTNMDGFDPSYEWHFMKQKSAGVYEEMFVRYEEDTQYTFYESGTYNVELRTKLDDQGNELSPKVVTITILESKLEFPNAFSPNGDGVNDTFKAKDGWKSIVKFKAIILNRWGQKLYEWNDPAGEWDGKYKGKVVNDGVYFLYVNAKGADGHVYEIRKDINVLKGLNDRGSSSSTP